MYLTFTYTEDEFVEMRRRGTPWQLARRIDTYAGHSTGWRLQWVSARLDRIAMSLVFVATVGLWLLHRREIGAYIPAGLLVLVLADMIPKRLKARGGRSIRKEFQSHDRYAGPIHVDLRDEGLTWTTPTWTAEIEWRGVLDQYETPQGISIIDATPRLMLIPDRAFASAQEKELFLSTLRTKRSSAQHPVT